MPDPTADEFNALIARLTTMTDAQFDALIVAIQEQRQQRAAQQAQQAQDLHISIHEAIAQLDALIGPDNPSTPAMTSLTEVRLYSRADMHANAGLGLELAFQALELLARTTRDIAAARG